MRKNFQIFASYFFVNFIAYLTVSIGIRALAAGLVLETFVSDVIYATVFYFIVKKVADATGRAPFIGFVLGGATGSAIAIPITQLIF